MEDTSLAIRKLAWVGFGFTFGIIANQYFNAYFQTIAVVIVAVVAVICMLRGRLMRQRVAIFVISMAIGMFWSSIYTVLTANKLEDLDGQTISVRAVCSDKIRYGETYAKIDVDIIDGANSKFSATLFDFDEMLPELKAGDIISADMIFSRADRLYGEQHMYNLAKDMPMTAYLQSEVTVAENGAVLSYPRRITNAIEDIVAEIFPQDVSRFMTALLTGIKDGYYKDETLVQDITYAGLAHIIAVSGMHVTFFVGAFMLLGGRKRALVVGTLAIAIFVMMIGATAPIIRACVMCMALIISQTIRRESDNMTTLFAVLIVILIQNPLAIHSVSLQLSFAAMFGIVCLASRMIESAMNLFSRKHMNWILYRLIFGVVSIASISISACIATTPLVAWHFGYITMYGVITNVLTYLVVSVVFCMGYVACGVYAIVPSVGIFIANILAYGARYIFFVCEKVADLPHSVLYVQNIVYILWLGYVYLIFSIAMALRGKRNCRPIAPICLTVLTFMLCISFVNKTANEQIGAVTVLDIGQGQSILLRDKSDTILIDCGSSKTLENAGDVVATKLLSSGVYDIDVLMLTHLHSDHANGVTTLLHKMEIRQIIMPENPNDDDEMLGDILTLAEEKGTEITYIDSDKILELGNIEVQIFAPLSDVGSANERGIFFLCDINNFQTLITGDVSSKVETELINRKNIPEIELLIAGHHGSASSSGLAFIKELNPKYVAISTGYNTYGHPTDEAMLNAMSFGADLYRTDLNGNITFKCIGEEDGEG